MQETDNSLQSKLMALPAQHGQAWTWLVFITVNSFILVSNINEFVRILTSIFSYIACFYLEWFMSRKGLAASSHLESGGFARSSPNMEHPDIQLHFLPSTVHDDGRANSSCHGYQVTFWKSFSLEIVYGKL